MKLEDVILRDDRASQPAANTVPIGTLYYVTDESVMERSDGAAWEDVSTASGSGITELTGDVTAGPGSGSEVATIANLAVTTAKIDNLAVTSGKLGALAATTAKIDNGAVTEGKQTLADVTTHDVTSAAHGYAPKSPGAAGRYLNGLATPAYGLQAMDFIETITPTGTNAVFSSLGAYNHLRIIMNGRGDTAAASVGVFLFFNADTAANYDRQVMSANNVTVSAAESLGVNNQGILVIPAASATANNSAMADIIIADYRGTAFHKLAISTNFLKIGTASGSLTVRQTAWGWRNAAAITSLTFTCAAGNFVTGTKISVYGYY